MLFEENQPKEQKLLNDNIQVCIRVRPMSQQEKVEGNRSLIEYQNNSLILQKSQGDKKIFTFDTLYKDTSTQEEIFKKTGQQMIENFMNGYNCTIFAYGQTGAGKTFTMMGDLNQEKYIGLQPKCIDYLFYLLSEQKRQETLIKITFVEIYNEKIIDLLSDDLKSLNIREDLKKGVFLENVTEEVVNHSNEAMDILQRGIKNRHVSETMMNNQSSRSHSIFTINFQTCSEENECASYTSSRFNFVDLAGSERQRLTLTTGERFKEGCQINKSLTVLGSVINSLAEISKNEKQRHIRYRDSKLTFLLKNSLGGNSKTAFIANISPASCFFVETLSTLLFAQRAKMIKNEAKINENVKSKSLHALKQELLKTKDELNYLKEKYKLLEKNQLEYSGITQGKCEDCSMVKKRLESKVLEKTTLLQECLVILRKSMMSWESQIIEGNFENEQMKDIQNLLNENKDQMKKVILLVGIENCQLETQISDENQKEESLIRLCDQKIKYYQEQNKKLEEDMDKMYKDFEAVEQILKEHFSNQNEKYELIKNGKLEMSKEISDSVEIFDKEKKLKIERMGLELQKNKTELKLLREQDCKLKNEISILQERNKMLKSWNEQTLQDKKTLNDALEKIRYEKFNLMKKFDEEFEQTKQKNEILLEDIEQLENEKNILQEGFVSIQEELKIFKDQNLNFANEIEEKNQLLQKIQERNQILEKDFEKQKNEFENLFIDYNSLQNKYEKLEKDYELLKKNNENQKIEFQVRLQAYEQQNKVQESKIQLDTQNFQKILKENQQMKIENSQINSLNEQNSQNLKQAMSKSEKIVRQRDNFLKTLESLKKQNKQFFGLLVSIKEKLNPENQSIFDDFMSVAQIHLKNKDLTDTVNDLKQKNLTLEKQLKKHLQISFLKSNQVKKIYEKLMLKQKYIYESLDQKNKTIEFYQENMESYQKFSQKLQNFVKIQNQDFSFEDTQTFLEKKNILENQKENLIQQGFQTSVKKVTFNENIDNIDNISKKIKFDQLIVNNEQKKQFKYRREIFIYKQFLFTQIKIRFKKLLTFLQKYYCYEFYIYFIFFQIKKIFSFQIIWFIIIIKYILFIYTYI